MALKWSMRGIFDTHIKDVMFAASDIGKKRSLAERGLSRGKKKKSQGLCHNRPSFSFSLSTRTHRLGGGS